MQPTAQDNFNLIAQALSDYLATLPASCRHVMTPALQQALNSLKPPEPQPPSKDASRD